MQAIVSETFVMFNLKQVSIRDFLISMMKKVSQCKQIQNAKSEWAMEKRQTQMCRLFDVHKKVVHTRGTLCALFIEPCNKIYNSQF